jgi:DUF1680 family protein
MDRRDFLKGVAITGAVAGVAPRAAMAVSDMDSRVMNVSAFNYDGVLLKDSRWKEQYEQGRDFYFNVNNDDILHGNRLAAGMPAPGKPLGGWCAKNSNTVFGQWLSGMSRMYRATNDTEIRDKASYLLTEFAKTVGPDGNAGMAPYPYEKLVCGLVDMHEFVGHPEAMPLLERVTSWSSKNFDRTRAPANPKPWEMHSGKPLEWYTLPENLYRAFQLTGNQQFKEFADVWLYDAYWSQFENSASPAHATGVHAYSHVNSFSSASMRYAMTRNPAHLRILENAYDFLQNTQCYATGGYGPVERLMPSGSLGKALESQLNTCETPCCSWAGFKMSRYLMQFTGKARYGDWAERLLYNGIGAALRIHGDGRHFYYADYRLNGGVKVDTRNQYTCCSGTYIQNIADFHNLIYHKDNSNLYVNLYVPSELTWRRADGQVKIAQDTRYPEEETSKFTLTMDRGVRFGLKFRIPEWSRGANIKVNGVPAQLTIQPGTWATVERAWNSGDTVEIQIPLPLRYQAVDAQHPQRVAIVRGPVTMVLDGLVHEPIYKLPDNDEDLNKLMVPDQEPAVFRYAPRDGTNVMSRLRPFYAIGPDYYYRMYLDMDKLPIVLWS